MISPAGRTFAGKQVGDTVSRGEKGRASEILSHGPSRVYYEMLLQEQEADFRIWYADVAKRYSLDPDPYSSRQGFDYRLLFDNVGGINRELAVMLSKRSH